MSEEPTEITPGKARRRDETGRRVTTQRRRAVRHDYDGLPFRLEPLEDTTHVVALIYGMTGAGKTFLIGTAQDCEATAPCLILVVGGGDLTLRAAGRTEHVARPATWREFMDVYDWLRHDNDRYRSVAIDSVTDTQRQVSMGGVMGEIGEEGEYLDLESMAIPDRQDWLRSGEQMRRMFRAFRDLAYLADREKRLHVFFTCLERLYEQKKTVCPSLPGQLGTDCGAYVDILGRLSKQVVEEEDDAGEIQTVVRRHLLVDDYTDDRGIRYLAKNRGNLGTTVWDPTIRDLVEGWKRR